MLDIMENVEKNEQSTDVSEEDLELLAKLEEQNRLIETKMKSITQSDQSRRSSQTSDLSIENKEQQSTLRSSLQQQTITDTGPDLTSVEEVVELWGLIASDWSNYSRKQRPLITDLVRRGIPSSLRGLIWQLLCNVYNNREQVREKYPILLKQRSPCEKIIKRDIPRTFPEHEYFKTKGSLGQEGLFNVIKAYSLFDTEVGYCQGSAFIVALLLLNMPEEDVFTVFQSLMYDYRLREMFKPTMAELGLCIYQLECMVQEMLPELYNHFQQQNYHTSMYASSWFLTLFTSSLPLSLANRVMDLFLSEGIEIIFRLSIAILQLCRDDLLKLDMGCMLRYFQREMPKRCELDADYLVNLAVNVRYDSKRMKKLAKEYTAIKSKEQEELVELRRLRTENRLLRQKIDILEQESGELADKLIQGQVCRAQEAEDNFVIKRELAASKQFESEALNRIKSLQTELEQTKQKQKLSQSLECKEHRELVESLQEELIAVKLRDAENNEEMKLLRQRIQQLEDEIVELRKLPEDHATARLQDELSAIKLREGEAILSNKELKDKISELQTMWNEHMMVMHPDAGSDPSQPSSLEANGGGSKESSLNSGSLNNTIQQQTLSVTSSPMKILNAVKRNFDQPGEINRLKTELMTVKLREAESFSELKEMRQKVMELETKNGVTMNQIRRQAEEMRKLQLEFEELIEKERNATTMLNQEKGRYSDLDFQMKEENMMKRIKELEQTQLVAELRQKISSLETKIEEYVTKNKLNESGEEPNTAEALQDRMAELQTEMFRLDVSKRRLHTLQQQNGDL